MTVSEFFNEVARRADTGSTKINVAETRRVLAVAFDVLNELGAAQSHDIVAKALAQAQRRADK